MASLVNVTFSILGPVATLTMNRPDALNAFNRQTADDFYSVCHAVEGNPAIRALILRANGRAFCAGGDLAFVKSAISEPGDFERFVRYLNGALNAIEDLPVPTIAAIHGYCLAGGLELAMCCDFRILADNATIGDQHINYGLIPGGGNTQRLPRLIGLSRAKELMLTGDWLTPAEAERIGLVNRVVPPDRLIATAEALAAKLASKSPVAARAIKGLVNMGTQADLRTGLEMEQMAIAKVSTSEDFAEGLSAFAEKRDPVFRGR